MTEAARGVPLPDQRRRPHRRSFGAPERGRRLMCDPTPLRGSSMRPRLGIRLADVAQREELVGRRRSGPIR